MQDTHTSERQKNAKDFIWFQRKKGWNEMTVINRKRFPWLVSVYVVYVFVVIGNVHVPVHNFGKMQPLGRNTDTLVSQ